ncbi:hypothetical protein WJX73_007637 [Symbiochloris irregularis]|uniref:GB1/RHD3-type G domain-containing protein n=1 Tax=Symbiochloris irregularis TaxID=706552 RepID=A0AAW1PSD7_9CHLO
MSATVQQLVSSEGEFETAAVERFFKDQQLDGAGVNYQIVAVTGPQSSGKSTLMNTLFGTDFTEMNAMSGRQQTTKGIWMAQATKVQEPLTLVLDLEGSDGRERGEDDNSFERQSSLFALAITDILVVNMWAKDIGREAGAGKPLLKTIFQVNLKLFAPSPNRQRTVLLFVFRDKTKTPLRRLIETWEEDLAQMWDSITKPVEYASLPNYEEKEDDFKAETYLLRKRFSSEEDESLVAHSGDRLPGSSLALSMSELWQVIKEQRDLNLPAHKVMVATVRCAELANAQLQALQSDQAFSALQQAASASLMPTFAQTAEALVGSCLAGYDEEARYFEEGVRAAKGLELKTRAFDLLTAAFQAQLGFHRAAALQHVTNSLAVEGVADRFASIAAGARQEALQQFAQGAKQSSVTGSGWDAWEETARVETDIDALIKAQSKLQVDRIIQKSLEELKTQVNRNAEPLFDSCPQNMWQRLGGIVESSSKSATEVTKKRLRGFQLPEADVRALDRKLCSQARAHVQQLARTASSQAGPRMTQRFSELFSDDENHIPRTWGTKVNIPAVTQAARQGAAEVLALLAVDRLADPEADFSVVDRAVRSLAAEAPQRRERRATESGGTTSTATLGSAASRPVPEIAMLDSEEWPGIDRGSVLLTPGKCMTLWKQLVSESGRAIQQAIAVQDMRKATSNRWPPLWAIVAMAVLGFNEFTAMLYNPFLLISLILVLLFGKTVYDELEVDAEMQNGLLPGSISLLHKFVPTVRSVAQKTITQAPGFFQARLAQASDLVNASSAAAGAHAHKHPRPHTTRPDGSAVEMTHRSNAAEQSYRDPTAQAESARPQDSDVGQTESMSAATAAPIRFAEQQLFPDSESDSTSLRKRTAAKPYS